MSRVGFSVVAAVCCLLVGGPIADAASSSHHAKKSCRKQTSKHPRGTCVKKKKNKDKKPAPTAPAETTTNSATTPAATGRAQHAVAHNVVSGPIHLEYNADRAAGAPSTQATGVFDAILSAGDSKLVHVQGPITCLDVRGNDIGLFYPLSGSEPAQFKDVVRGIYIYGHVDGKGKMTAVGFSQSARPYTAGCAPIPSVSPATGYGEADS